MASAGKSAESALIEGAPTGRFYICRGCVLCTAVHDQARHAMDDPRRGAGVLDGLVS
jgi:hypothetical protein